MRKKFTISCSISLLVGLLCLLYVRNCYNVVSHQEILAVRERLEILSPQEKQDLAFFIDEIISFDPYPYTLIDYKPMSICNVFVEDPGDLDADGREAFNRPRHQKEMRGFLVWKKYQSLFPRTKHILVDYSFLGVGRREVSLISPAVCRNTIQDHLDDFREILGKPCTSKEVFEILTQPEHPDFYTIIDHARLVGILLGFGRNNSYLFEQYRGASRSDVGHQRSLQDPLQSFSDEWPWPGRKLSPCFACDPNTEETKQLKKHYQKAGKIVQWTYFLRNNLEVTLALLMQN